MLPCVEKSSLVIMTQSKRSGHLRDEVFLNPSKKRLEPRGMKMKNCNWDPSDGGHVAPRTNITSISRKQGIWHVTIKRRSEFGADVA